MNSGEEWLQEPSIIRVSDDVEPGSLFTIYGEGFSSASEVYVSRNFGEIPTFAEAYRVKCEVTGIDMEGQSIICRLPQNIPSACYNLWATNEYGTSVAVPLNAARPQWATVDTLAPGLEFKVIGKNLSAKAYGGSGKSYVVLSNGTKHYFMETVEQNPFAITVKCPKDIESGDYDVYVSNDGLTWILIEDRRQIYVSEVLNDPLELGVEWANRYNWDNVITLTAEQGDNTSKIQNAIDSVSESGGVVMLSEGEYDITEITIKPGVVLLGEGKDKTILRDIGTSDYLIHMMYFGDLFGLANLQIYTEQNKKAVIEGYENGSWTMNASARTGEYVFLKNVKGVQPKETKSGPFVAIFAKSHFLMADCEVSGYEGNLKSTYITEYAYLLNNSFDTVIGNTILVATYADIEGNSITRRGIDELAEGQKYTQGIFTRGPSYVANNTIKKIGSYDSYDGEIICTEDNPDFKLFGTVKSADNNSICVSPYDNPNSDWDLKNVYWGEPYLIITSGRGLGQYRKVIDWDESSKVIIIDEAFDVKPDETSQFAVCSANVNVTMYGNYAENTSKGYWLYGRSLDCVISNNTGVNTEGVFIVTKFENDQDALRCNVDYFVRICDNNFIGNSVRFGVCGIGIFHKILTTMPKDIPCLGIYGLEIVGNSIKPDSFSETTESNYEETGVNGISFLTTNNSSIGGSHMKAVIIADNLIKNSDIGIMFRKFGGKTDNIRIDDNRFENVYNPYVVE